MEEDLLILKYRMFQKELYENVTLEGYKLSIGKGL
jgi:hypothetical protein